MKYHSETRSQNTVIKQRKELNGDLKSEHKKTTNKTLMSPTTDIDSQAATIHVSHACYVLLSYFSVQIDKK